MNLHFRPTCLVPILLVVACAETAPPAPATPPAPPVVLAPTPPVPPAEPYVHVRIQPRVDPVKVVHVDIELDGPGLVGVFRMVRGAPDVLSQVTLSDAQGTIATTLAADGEGLTLSSARPASGVTRLSYDVTANTDSPFDPLAERVLDDRFIGGGEGLLFLPEGLDDETLPLELVIDGALLRAPNAASTWGLGAAHRAKGRPRSLRHLSFLAGSLGGAVFDTAGEHDEAAWLGYTAFDPRPAAAEIAQVRSAMVELFRDHEFHEEEQGALTSLFASGARPLGSYSTTVRSGGVLVELGPSEPWSAPLRLSIAQQVVRHWIGGQLWVGPHDGPHQAESYWFTEGVARFFVTRLLARLGLMRPDDVRDALVGEVSVILASHHKGESNVALAGRAMR